VTILHWAFIGALALAFFDVVVLGLFVHGMRR
jgi:hypothetical protein